jgi:hypothetical protein
MTDGQRQQGQASRELTELTGIAEIGRFCIWSSTKNGTEIWRDVNDAIVFQVDQLGYSVSGGSDRHDITTEELTAPSIVLFSRQFIGANFYDSVTTRS